MMNFLNPLDALISKTPFGVTSGARGSVSIGFSGAQQVSPIWRGVAVQPRGCIDPPELKARAPQGRLTEAIAALRTLVNPRQRYWVERKGTLGVPGGWRGGQGATSTNWPPGIQHGADHGLGDAWPS